jgi:hypothetical protein
MRVNSGNLQIRYIGPTEYETEYTRVAYETHPCYLESAFLNFFGKEVKTPISEAVQLTFL